MSTPQPSSHPVLFAPASAGSANGEQVRAGMLWSAWADALGFISELTDERGLRRRTGDRPLTMPYAWERRVGGRMGVRAPLPQGCYSDDTQLRLATARAISGNGFDVEAFAEVELAVWPSYALGGGRASKAAAARIVRPSSAWFSNQFEGWHEAGGNGAAMRVQPHAWSGSDDRYLVDVLRNAVSTHGHPRALVGAVLIAAATRHALQRGRTPSQSDWRELLRVSDDAVRAFSSDDQLAGYWRPQWERAAKKSIEQGWAEAIAECDELFQAVGPLTSELGAVDERDASSAYAEIVRRVRLDDGQVRGSGTLTVVAALAVAAAFPESPFQAALVPSLAIGTDTDTIATMAAAVVGTASPVPLPTPVQDETYLVAEADRLTAIREGARAAAFSYPDLLHWSGPRSALDCVGIADGDIALAGLGPLELIDTVGVSRDAAWTWVRSGWGQTLLVKHRQRFPELPRGNWPNKREMSHLSRAAASPAPGEAREASPQLAPPRPNEPAPARPEIRSTPKGDVESTPKRDVVSTPKPDVESMPKPDVESSPRRDVESTPKRDGESTPKPDVDSMLRWVENEGFAFGAIGYAVGRLSEVGSIEQLVAFTVALRAELKLRGRT